MIKYYSKFGRFGERGTFEGIEIEVIEDRHVFAGFERSKAIRCPKVRISGQITNPLYQDELSSLITALMVARDKMED